ncbi:MAG: hypothetical protein QXJ11_03215 [Candidatus Bathyarchaeia archaeon]
MVKIKLKKDQKTIYVDQNCEILELAEKLKIPVNDTTFIQKVLQLGMASPYSEEQLLQKIKELEEQKRTLESRLKKIAVQFARLESRHVGLRAQISKLFNDNRVQVFHLCARHSPSMGEHDATNLVQKYVEYSKCMWL